MPEIAEVTTIVGDLNRSVRGRKIAAFSGDTPKMIRPHTFTGLVRKLKGLFFSRFERKGKYIVGYLSEGGGKEKNAVIWHMRMTGHLLLRDEARERPSDRKRFADPKNRFVRLSILFEDGCRLDYSDMRKFGIFKLVPTEKVAEEPGIKLLGPDALKEKWDGGKIKALLGRRSKAVKTALLDQSVVAGIGNIYADEILWHARVHPEKVCRRLSVDECARIAAAIEEIIPKAVKMRGTSIDDYRDLSGRTGNYGKVRLVHRRRGEKCFRCGKIIDKIKVGGRGTHYCPACQRKTNKN